MTFTNKVLSRKTINTAIFTKYKLSAESLKLLLEHKSEIKVSAFVHSSSSLLDKVSQNNPDVVIFYLMDDEHENIELLPKLFEIMPSAKVLILTDTNSSILDQKKILEMGATGIVGTNQKDEVLIRAIRQVSEGEVWFSQKLIAQLLSNGKNGGAESAKKGGLKYQYLTEREIEVVKSIALGLNNKDISKKLFISEATVRHHLSSVYSKLYVEDRLNLVIYAYQHDIIRRPTNK